MLIFISQFFFRLHNSPCFIDIIYVIYGTLTFISHTATTDSHYYWDTTQVSKHVCCSKSWLYLSLLGQWPIQLELLAFVVWSDQEYFYTPLDQMLVHCRVTPDSIKISDTHMHTPGWREALSKFCVLPQEHKCIDPGWNSNVDYSMH